MSAVTKEAPAAVAVQTAPSLVSRFAARYHVEPGKLLSTLKATAFYSADGEVTNEQMMALLIVADQYGLNPFTREIYAFPDKKKGGIVPIVSIDGWSRIVNEQPTFDGLQFEYGPSVENRKGAPAWIECVLHRKDREHPTRVREWLIECYRDTGPWNSHPARMLRHKAFMQCGRIAFALVGIYDEDEAQRIIDGQVREYREEPPGIANINDKIKGATTINGESQHVDDLAGAAGKSPEGKGGEAVSPTNETAASTEKKDTAETKGKKQSAAGAGPTVADISTGINKAKTMDELNTARDLIRYVPNEFQAELEKDAAAKAAQLAPKE